MSAADSGRYFGEYGGSGPENYERFFVSTIGRPLAERLIDLAGLLANERVLDVACGTGIVARLAAAKGCRVTGLDLNPAMLDKARSLEPSIEWIEASAERMPIPDGAFDVVLSQLGLMFIPDKDACLRETRRVLVPGGRLYLSVHGDMTSPWQSLAEEMRRYVGEAPFRFLHTVYGMNDRPALEALVQRAGFREVATCELNGDMAMPTPALFLRQFLASTPMGAMVAEASDQAMASVEQAVTERWQPFVEGDHTRFPYNVIVVTAIK